VEVFAMSDYVRSLDPAAYLAYLAGASIGSDPTALLAEFRDWYELHRPQVVSLMFAPLPKLAEEVPA
jgi:hypothetical protein